MSLSPKGTHRTRRPGTPRSPAPHCTSAAMAARGHWYSACIRPGPRFGPSHGGFHPMTYERRVVTRRDDAGYVAPTSTGEVVERTVVAPSGGEFARRVVTLIFGVIQTLIVLRIVLLLLDAREGNDLVSFILNASQL